MEKIKSWEETKRFEGCLVACKADFKRAIGFEYETSQGLFNGVKYGFISKGIVGCDLCDNSGYKINFFCDRKNEGEKLKIVLCSNKLGLAQSYFKARLLTIEEIKRISDLMDAKKYFFGEKSFELKKTEILKITNLLPEEKIKYLRKYLYNKSLSIRLILINIYKDENSLFGTLPMEMNMYIFRFIIENEVRDYKNDSLLLEL